MSLPSAPNPNLPILVLPDLLVRESFLARPNQSHARK